MAFWADDESEKNDGNDKNDNLPQSPMLICCNRKRHPLTDTSKLTPEVDNSGVGFTGGAMIIHPRSRGGKDTDDAPCPRSQSKEAERSCARTTAVTDTLSPAGSSGVRLHIIMEEYRFERRGSPSIVGLLLLPRTECDMNWSLPAKNRGSIEQLAAHRESHRVFEIMIHGHNALDYRWVGWAHIARVMFGWRTSPTAREKGALVAKMSKKGATPGEWRLLRVHSGVYGSMPRRMLLEARRGIKGAEIELPGIGSGSNEALRQHLNKQADALYCKFGVKPPGQYQLWPDRYFSKSVRCQCCAARNVPLLDCIADGRVPCAPCMLMGFRCVPGQKHLPAKRDILRMKVLGNKGNKVSRDSRLFG